MSDEITRVEFQPSPERRTPQKAPEEQRSFLSVLASDANQVSVGTAIAAFGTAAAYGVKALFEGKGGPPDACQSKGQDPAPPQGD